jgi:hypothetical protein
MIQPWSRPNSYKLHYELDKSFNMDFFRFIVICSCKLRVCSEEKSPSNFFVNSHTVFACFSYIRQYQLDCYGSHVDVSVFTTKPVNSVAVSCIFINWKARHPLLNLVMTSCKYISHISYKQVAICE